MTQKLRVMLRHLFQTSLAYSRRTLPNAGMTENTAIFPHRSTRWEGPRNLGFSLHMPSPFQRTA